MDIALCLSGGGYRAAVYHIGVLLYLDSIKTEDGNSLLDYVNILSSVSGGSLTALWYVTNKAEGATNRDSFLKLYKSIVENDIERHLYEDFKVGAKNGNTLIVQLASVYDKIFFQGKKYNIVLSAINREDFNIHHFAVCATDFNNGRPFHFYASRPILVNEKYIDKLKIGNSDSLIDHSIAGEMSIADIMAASSCFPGLFEPIVFPNDFKFDNPTMVEAITKESFTLMDGGIVDNQGIEAIVKLDGLYKKNDSSIDFIIVSDVAKASPQKFDRSKVNVFSEDESFMSSIKNNIPWYISKYKYIRVCSLFSAIATIFGAIVTDGMFRLFFTFASSILLMVFTIYTLFIRIVPRYYNMIVDNIKEKFAHKLSFDLDEQFVKELKTNSILDFFKNRINSLMLMVNDVMMGQIRKHKLRQAFGGKTENRTIVNAIYALTSSGTWKQLKKKLEIENEMRPNNIIMKNSDEVANIGTRLCFSGEQINNDIPKKLVACGQYTTCWNLLMWIKRNKGQASNDDGNETQHLLIQMEKQLKNDWEQFKINPFYKSII